MAGSSAMTETKQVSSSTASSSSQTITASDKLKIFKMAQPKSRNETYANVD